MVPKDKTPCKKCGSFREDKIRNSVECADCGNIKNQAETKKPSPSEVASRIIKETLKRKNRKGNNYG